METPTLHMHTLKIGVFDATVIGHRYSFESAKRQLSERLSLFPAFRRRLVELPLGFHHPVWIEDASFDLDAHMHRLTLPWPGGRREMDAAIGEIASRPLDRRRPLWEVWVLEGLADGGVAGVAKIHHCLADGMAAAELLAHVMSPAPDSVALVPPRDAWRPEPVPTRARLVRDALSDHVRQLRRLPGLLRRTLRNLVRVARRRRGAGLLPPVPVLDTPRTPFNTTLTPRRAFHSGDLPLAGVKEASKHFGVTVNDVLLALVAGSLRSHLGGRGRLPAAALVAAVPISTDPSPRLFGNRTSNLFTSLCTDVEDRVARLRAIHEVTRVAKESHRLLGIDMYEEWVAYAPPRVVNGWARAMSRLRLADRFKPFANVIVSSVPGPRRPLFWVGHRLRALYSVGPILEGMCLNVTLWSYAERIFVGILACPDRVDGLEEIASGLSAELDALLAAARQDASSRVP
jgi:diacylglycerol O-acyltransferase